jgi:hypothetical protein
MNNNYNIRLAGETENACKLQPGLHGHRSLHPWLIGAPGESFAGI